MAGIDGADMTSGATAGDDDDDDAAAVLVDDGEPVAIERRFTGPFVFVPVKLKI